MILPDGTNVNHALVKDGRCWLYRKYALDLKLRGQTPLMTLLPCAKTHEVGQP